jgi:predicted esterase
MNAENLQTDLKFTAEINLYYDLFVPAGAGESSPLLIAVHGYGAHKRYMMRESRLIAPDNFVIASVQGPHQHFRRKDDSYRIGFGWLTDHKPEENVRLHHEFLLNVIDKLDDDGLIDRRRICLFGFSQACALNFRFAFSNPNVLRGVLGVCGGIPGDIDTNPEYRPFGADTLYIYGDDDEFYSLEKFAAFDAKLRERLPNYESKRYAAKHEITNEMRDGMRAWLISRG